MDDSSSARDNLWGVNHNLWMNHTHVTTRCWDTVMVLPGSRNARHAGFLASSGPSLGRRRREHQDLSRVDHGVGEPVGLTQEMDGAPGRGSGPHTTRE